jgi:hypothetical protein
MIAYKLTDENLQTHNYTQWQIGEWKETNGEGDLCGPGWLHYYSSPLLAVLLNPIHAGFENPRLFEIEVAGEIKEDRGLKFGCTKMRLVKELELPAVTMEQRIKFAIYCALEICAEPEFVKWANGWLDGTYRSRAAVTEIAVWAANVVDAAAATDNDIDIWTSVVVNDAADAAYYYCYRAGCEADAAWSAARAAARAANAVDVKPFNLIEVAKKAMK